jgi:oxaloacetate decarboxylase alpha subunit
MKEIRFSDTTLRDGHMSLWASNMSTAMMLPIVERLDGAGFEAFELMSGSHFKKAARELKEDPFERIRLVTERAPNTPARMILGKINVFGFDPMSMFRLFMRLSAENGMGQCRISDPWNALEGWRFRVEGAREAGMGVVLNLTYTISPRHTDEYYAERTRLAKTLPIDRLCIKDPGGLLTPERTRSLVPTVLANAGDTPVEFHTHCTTGLGPLCCLEAIQHGIEIVNTAIPPLADGSSNPSIYNVAANARALGFEPVIDEDALRPITRHFTAVARREGFPIGAPVDHDHGQYLHQIPGGMISNLAHQLRLVGLEDKMAETLAETARVRAELGYPIMVTPLSQFVGSQAAINVVIGERYREVTDQVIEYALGYWGEEGAQGMDPDLKDRILGTRRARELTRSETHEPSLAEMHRIHGGAGVSDKEMLLRWLTSPEDVAAMTAAGPPRIHNPSGRPLIDLIEALTRRTDLSQIQVRKPGFSMTLGKSKGSP